MKNSLLLTFLLGISVLSQAGAEGPRVDPNSLNPKDTKWFDTRFHEASRKFPVRITVKTPRGTQVFRGMFLDLSSCAGRETRHNGVTTFSDGATVEISRSSQANLTVTEVKTFKAKWISVHWQKMAQVSR